MNLKKITMKAQQVWNDDDDNLWISIKGLTNELEKEIHSYKHPNPYAVLFRLMKELHSMQKKD